MMSDYAERKAFADRGHGAAAAEAGLANEQWQSNQRASPRKLEAEHVALRQGQQLLAGQQPRNLGDPFVQLDDGRTT